MHKSYTFALENLEKVLVELMLGEDASRQYVSGKVSKANLSIYLDDIRKISDIYTQSREQVASVMRTEKGAKAYSLYFTAINFAKVTDLLSKLDLSFKSESTLNILDYGCGPGTATLATIAHFENPLHVTAVDKSPATLGNASMICSKYCDIQERSDITLDFQNTKGEWRKTKYNLIIAANVVNELSAEEKLSLFSDFYSCLEENGVMIIIEPALKDVTRDLMRFHDKILGAGKGIEIIYPCTHEEPCPMLKNSERDWCHGFISWERPRLVSQIDELLGFNKHRIKYSALAIQKNSRDKKNEDRYRVVSIPVKDKRGVSAILCGPQTYQLFNISKKNKSPENMDFWNAELMDLVGRLPG